ncbi:MAG: aldehyde dehydrogenase [Pseudonocardia sp. SCN 72-86]|nr:MAG: aldehyde dehydrogenase [Pseudonocardia sp. SCN 72-86]
MESDRISVFVDGEWLPGEKTDLVEVVEPATEEPLARVVSATGKTVDLAVQAARAALRGPWGRTTPAERAEILERFAAALQSRGRETSRLVTRENGSPISLSKGTNGIAPAAITRYYAAMVRDQAVEEERTGFRGATVVRREPVGVVAAITPWNYPQSLAIMKIAPALAAGCTVVLKPPLEVGLDAFVFADAAVEAGLPAGVLNVVPGGRDIGRALVAHRGVDKVAFTGSSAAGETIGETCGRLLRPVTLELGGKSAGVVLDDADLDVLRGGLPAASFANNGQTCTVSSRILAPRSRYTEIVDAVTDVARGLRVGDPLAKETEIGPLVSRVQRDRVLGFVERAERAGARMTTGGGAPAGVERGWYVSPTVFADVDNSSEIGQEEVFGPVIAVIPYSTEEEAVALANDTRYGLAGTVWTSDRERGLGMARRLETGAVGLNYFSLHLEGPFGGIKASGLGKELGPEGLAPYQTLKSIYLPD